MSIRMAARLRSVIRSACPERGLLSPRCINWKLPAASARSPPCALVLGRAFHSRSSGYNWLLDQGCAACSTGVCWWNASFHEPERRT